MTKNETMYEDAEPDAELTDEELGIDNDELDDLLAQAIQGSDEIEINLSEELGVLPAGPYRLRFVKWEQKKSKKGLPMIVFSFTVQTAGPHYNRKISQYSVLAGPGAPMIKPILGALGQALDPDVNKQARISVPKLNAAIGAELNVDLEVDGTFNKIKDPRPV